MQNDFLSVDAMLGSQPASKFPVWGVQGKPGYLETEAEASPAARERKEEEESTAKMF